MSDAPSLPAQTPGMFVGGGGSGTSLSGECAAAAADCGLSAVDIAPFEQVVAVVRAAQERCAEYDDARWLAERERELDHHGTHPERSSGNETRLPRSPTPRERHLSGCVAAPLCDPAFILRTGIVGPAGYLLLAAPSGPQARGLTPRLGVHHASSTLRPELRVADGRALPPGAALDAESLRRIRDRRIAEMLRDAADEDQPRLRSTDLTSSTRPRQLESERRAIEQELPAPPQLASTASAEVSGAQTATDRDESGAETRVQREAQGCVGSTAEAQESAMRRQVQEEYDGGYVGSQQEAQNRERGTRREVDRRQIAHDEALLDREDAVAAGADVGRTAAAERRAATALVRALVDLGRAALLVAALPTLRLRALELLTSKDAGLEGRMPDVAARRPEHLPARSRIIRDE